MCQFCDTEFVGVGPDGGKFETGAELASAVRAAWQGNGRGKPYVVCTGGEPLLQLDREAIDAFHAAGFEVAIETNGTCLPPEGIDWITVSPKAERRDDPEARRRVEAGVSAGRRPAGAIRGLGLQRVLSAADVRAGRWRRTRARRWSIAWSIRSGD